MDNKSDHDLLIELNKTVELIFKQQHTAHQQHLAEDAVNFTEIKGLAKAAHTRLDTIFSIKDKVIGAVAFISFLFGTIVSILALIK